MRITPQQTGAASHSTAITLLLAEWRNGNAEAVDRLFGLIYSELYRMARGQRRRMWSIDTLNTTALVHEAYLKLIDQSGQNWEDRAHFLAVASTAMRHILINYAERKRTRKRGGDWRQVTFDDAPGTTDGRVESLLAIQQALVHLADLDPRLVRIVDCRFFGGLTEPEIACVLGITERTVRREWSKAKAVLAKALSSGDATHSDQLHAVGGQ
jgi:RNA polymerase sigma factor (TIGR02999 family)